MLLMNDLVVFSGKSYNFQLNKIAARWPAKAVAQLSFSQ